MSPVDEDVALILSDLGQLSPRRPRPALVVLGGLPGSGKSTVCHALGARVPIAVLQSDRVRKLFAPRPEYTAEESTRVFTAIHAAAAWLLSRGRSVVVDSTALARAHRAPFTAIARATGARLIRVWVFAPDRVVRARLAARAVGVHGAYDRSDAGVAVYEAMQVGAEPMERPHLRINTGDDITVAVSRLAAMVTDGMTGTIIEDERGNGGAPPARTFGGTREERPGEGR